MPTHTPSHVSSHPSSGATLATVQKLIAIASTADKPLMLQAALDIITSVLRVTEGVTIEQFESDGKPSLLAYFGPHRPERFKLILNGHLDVVDGQPDQFKPSITATALRGRGALDMKTAAVVMTEVFCELADDLEYPVGLQIVTDEEIGGKNGTGYQIKAGVLADFVIAGEATPFASICTESRGMCWAEVQFQGESAHSAYPWMGRNAILQANTFISKLVDYYPMPTGSQWLTTVNVASVSTPNETFNRVPDSAVVKLDMRYVSDDTNFTDEATLLRFLNSLAPDASVTLVLHEPSHFTDSDGTAVRQLADAIEKTTGTPATCIQKHGAADLRFYSAIGTPAVGLGLQGNNAHGDDEYVEIASIEQYRAILESFLNHL